MVRSYFETDLDADWDGEKNQAASDGLSPPVRLIDFVCHELFLFSGNSIKPYQLRMTKPRFYAKEPRAPRKSFLISILGVLGLLATLALKVHQKC